MRSLAVSAAWHDRHTLAAYISKQDKGGGIDLLHYKIIQQAHANVVMLVHT
jgi:hypothetical protein